MQLQSPQKGEVTVGAKKELSFAERVELKRPSHNLPLDKRGIWERIKNIFESVEPVKNDVFGRGSQFSTLRCILAAGNNFVDEFMPELSVSTEMLSEYIDEGCAWLDEEFKEYVNENFSDNIGMKALAGIDISEEELCPEGISAWERINRMKAMHDGAFLRGVVVKGLGGSVKDLTQMALQPGESLEGMAQGLEQIETDPIGTGKAVANYIKENIENMDMQDVSELMGQGAFEVASELIPGKQVKDVAKVTRTVDNVTDITKVTRTVDNVTDITKVTRTVDNVTDITKVTRAMDNVPKLDAVARVQQAAKKVPIKSKYIHDGKNVLQDLKMEGSFADGMYHFHMDETIRTLDWKSTVNPGIYRQNSGTVILSQRDYDFAFGNHSLEETMNFLEKNARDSHRIEAILQEQQGFPMRWLGEGKPYLLPPSRNVELPVIREGRLLQGQQYLLGEGNPNLLSMPSNVDIVQDEIRRMVQTREHIPLDVVRATGAKGKMGTNISPQMIPAVQNFVRKIIREQFNKRAKKLRKDLQDWVRPVVEPYKNKKDIPEHIKVAIDEKKRLHIMGNIGIAEVVLFGEDGTVFKKTYIAHSKIGKYHLDAREAFEFSEQLDETERVFQYIPAEVPSKPGLEVKTGKVNKHTYCDAEAKILENIVKDIENEKLQGVTGVIQLYSERECCESCIGVIEQMQKRYTGIRIEVFDKDIP